MRPGTRWSYRERGEEDLTRVEVTVTGRRRVVAGIDAVVVRDVVTKNGEVIEDTFDWYAQYAKGNVWYLGEDTKEFEDGKIVSTAGSWEAEGRATVPYGSFNGVLQTKDTTPLEPALVEHKFYARRLGPVLAIAVSNGGGREELVRFRRGNAR